MRHLKSVIRIVASGVAKAMYGCWRCMGEGYLRPEPYTIDGITFAPEHRTRACPVCNGSGNQPNKRAKE